MPPAPELPTEPVSVTPDPVPFGWDPGGAPPPAGPLDRASEDPGREPTGGRRRRPARRSPSSPSWSEPTFAEPMLAEPTLGRPVADRAGGVRARGLRRPGVRPGRFEPAVRSGDLRPARERFAGFEPVAPEAFEPVVLEPELSVFDPNEFEVPFEPLVGAGEFPDPVVVVIPRSTTSPRPRPLPRPRGPSPRSCRPPSTPTHRRRRRPRRPSRSPAGLGQAVFDGERRRPAAPRARCVAARHRRRRVVAAEAFAGSAPEPPAGCRAGTGRRARQPPASASVCTTS